MRCPFCESEEVSYPSHSDPSWCCADCGESWPLEGVMNEIELTDRELEILDFAICDLAEAAEDGDRPEFDIQEANRLVRKIHAERERRKQRPA